MDYKTIRVIYIFCSKDSVFSFWIRIGSFMIVFNQPNIVSIFTPKLQWKFFACRDIHPECCAIRIILDPGIVESKVYRSGLAITELRSCSPGAAKQIVLTEVNLTVRSLNTAITKAAGDGARFGFLDLQDKRHKTRVRWNGAQGDSDIGKQACAIETFQVLLQDAAVKAIPRLGGHFAGDDPALGAPADELSVFIGGFPVVVCKLDLNVRHPALTNREDDHPFRGDSRWPQHPGQGVALLGIPLLQTGQAPLQARQVNGSPLVRLEGLLHHLVRQQNILLFQLHRTQNRVGGDRHLQAHPQRPIDWNDPYVAEQARGVDGGEISFQLGAGRGSTRPHLHGVVGNDLKAFLFRVIFQPHDDHFGDGHLLLRGNVLNGSGRGFLGKNLLPSRVVRQLLLHFLQLLLQVQQRRVPGVFFLFQSTLGQLQVVQGLGHLAFGGIPVQGHGRRRPDPAQVLDQGGRHRQPINGLLHLGEQGSVGRHREQSRGGEGAEQRTGTPGKGTIHHGAPKTHGDLDITDLVWCHPTGVPDQGHGAEAGGQGSGCGDPPPCRQQPVRQGPDEICLCQDCALGCQGSVADPRGGNCPG